MPRNRASGAIRGNRDIFHPVHIPNMPLIRLPGVAKRIECRNTPTTSQLAVMKYRKRRKLRTTLTSSHRVRCRIHWPVSRTTRRQNLSLPMRHLGLGALGTELSRLGRCRESGRSPSRCSLVRHSRPPSRRSPVSVPAPAGTPSSSRPILSRRPSNRRGQLLPHLVGLRFPLTSHRSSLVP